MIRRIAVADIGPTPSILGKIAIPPTVGVAITWIEPIGNTRFDVERSDRAGRIVKVTAQKQ